jgi:hypothetical protein
VSFCHLRCVMPAPLMCWTQKYGDNASLLGRKWSRIRLRAWRSVQGSLSPVCYDVAGRRAPFTARQEVFSRPEKEDRWASDQWMFDGDAIHSWRQVSGRYRMVVGPLGWYGVGGRDTCVEGAPSGSQSCRFSATPCLRLVFGCCDEG